jgi:GNAT superfamily N-acetyltransferase
MSYKVNSNIIDIAMSRLTIRRYLPSDKAAVQELHVLALERVGAHAGPGSWNDDLEDIEGVYLNSGGEFLVGEVGGRVVAMGALRRTSEARAEVKRMRVHPDLQGRGYGQVMLSTIEARARELGYSQLHLDTTEQMLAAQGLYEKNGYREVGRESRGRMRLIRYEKDLQPA